ncbi:hypothetical protein C2S52_002952 [Perilla frutescens var. hirtella]|nr:hypothetical protein C2S52_002952 [Perilla frutescens var. hirtella]
MINERESGALDSVHEVWTDSDFGDSYEGSLHGEGDKVENDLLFKGKEKYSRNIVDGNGVIYKPDIHGKDPPLACGLIFSSRMEFKDAGHKTRSKALTIARGSDASQYGQIHDYALEIEKSNPALWAMNKDPMEYVDDCYSVAKYLECYDNCILPLNAPHDWQQTGIPAPMPPTYAKICRTTKKTETTCPLRKRNELGNNHDQENVVGCSKLHDTAPISTANVKSEATNHSFGEEKISDFSQMSYRDKYQLFGLEAPPYAVGQPPHLSNIRKSGPVLLNQPSSMSSDGLSQSALNLKFKSEQLKKNKVTTEQLEKNNAATKQLENNLPHCSESQSALNLKVKTEQFEKNKAKQLEKNKVTTKELEKNLPHCSESPISMMSHLSTSIYEKFGLPVPSFLMDKSKNATK